MPHKQVLSFVALTLIVLSDAMAGDIDPKLVELLVNSPPDTYFNVVVLLRERVDTRALSETLSTRKATRQERNYAVVTALQEKAAATQGPVLGWAMEEYERGTIEHYEAYWIENFVTMRAKPDVIFRVAERTDVEAVFLEPEIYYDPPLDFRETGENVNSTEIGLRVINAPALWRIGIRGQTRLVMNIDTGVNGNHVALASRWRGTLPGVLPQHAWYGPGSFPVDSDNNPGHGTHVMGTMTGMNPATADTIGVAPSALWIAGTGNYAGAFQWAINPDGNPGTVDDVPDVINCSWFSSGDQCFGGSIYGSLMDNCEAAGIAVIWSAGNCGPSGSASTCANGGVVPGPYRTLTPPKNRVVSDVNVFSVGALDGNSASLPIATFSSRGPSSCDTTYKRPQVSAPGVSVRSSIANGGYGNLSGTSMSAPHVAGTIALLRQVNPNAEVDQMKYALMETARDLGTPGRDNEYGTGVIDVLAAAGYLSPYQMRGTVRSTVNNQPIGLASVEVVQTGQRVTTDSTGRYRLGPLRDTAQVRFSAFAHYDTTISVILSAGVPETLNVVLQSFPLATLSGSVTDSISGQGIVSQLLFYAEGDPSGAPRYTTTSQPNGSYQISGTIGTYNIVVVPPAPYINTVRANNVALPIGGTTVSFRLLEAEVLYVDDDGGAFNEVPYLNSLKRLNYRTRSFNVAAQGGPPVTVLGTFTQRPIIVWTTGEDSTNALTSVERRLLISHLMARGKIIFSGFNIAEYSSPGDTLLERYLGIRFNGNSTTLFMRGFSGDIIGGGIVNWLVPGSSKDILTLLPGSIGTPTKTLYYSTTDNDTMNIAGVRVLDQSGRWGVTYFAFGLERLSGARVDTLILRSMRFFDQNVVAVSEPAAASVPKEFSLAQNYPNPFNPVTHIRYALPVESKVRLSIFNILGQEIARLVDGTQLVGFYEAEWQGTNSLNIPAPSGVYFYRLDAHGTDGRTFREVKKMLLLK